MSTPCMSDVSHVHDPFGRGFFALLPACCMMQSHCVPLAGWLARSLDPFNYRWEQVDRDKFGRKAQKASGEE